MANIVNMFPCGGGKYATGSFASGDTGVLTATISGLGFKPCAVIILLQGSFQLACGITDGTTTIHKFINTSSSSSVNPVSGTLTVNDDGFSMTYHTATSATITWHAVGM